MSLQLLVVSNYIVMARPHSKAICFVPVSPQFWIQTTQYPPPMPNCNQQFFARMNKGFPTAALWFQHVLAIFSPEHWPFLASAEGSHRSSAKQNTWVRKREREYPHKIWPKIWYSKDLDFRILKLPLTHGLVYCSGKSSTFRFLSAWEKSCTVGLKWSYSRQNQGQF